MSIGNQVIDSLLASVALVDGELVRISSNKTCAKADASAAATVSAFVGAVEASGSIAPGGTVKVVVGGLCRVRMETGLTLAAGNTVYVSSTVAGRGTNVEPPLNALAVGIIKDTTGYSVSNPFVFVDLQIAAFSGSANSAGWALDGVRYYAVDYDNGSDANVGYSDVSMADAGTKAIKTLTQLRAILPSDGAGRKVAVGVKFRDNANYLTPAGAIDYLDLRGVANYLWVSVQGTSDFSDDAADRLKVGGITQTAGPNADGSWTLAAGATASAFTIAAGALTAKPALYGYRVRWKGNVTAALANTTGTIYKNTGTVITLCRNATATPATGDEFFIERPGVWVENILCGPETNSAIITNQGSDISLAVIGFRFRESTLSGSAVPPIRQSINFAFCEWDIRGPYFRDQGDARITDTTTYVTAPTTFIRPGGCRVMRTLATGNTIADHKYTLVTLSSVALISTTNVNTNFSRCGRVSITGCTFYGMRLTMASCGIPETSPNPNSGSVFSQLGNFGASTIRPNLHDGTGVTGSAIQLNSGSSLCLYGIDFTNCTAIPCILLSGGYVKCSFDGLISTDGGNTDVAIDVGTAVNCQLWLGLAAANTIAPTAGNIRTPAAQLITFATIAGAPGRDTNNNVYQGTILDNIVATASLPAAGALPDGSQLIENGGAGVRNLILYASGQRFRIAGGAAF